MIREVVLGIDSGTQSTKVVALDLESGRTVAIVRAPHSGASVQDPRDWWSALVEATGQIDTSAMLVRGISIAGQQHGLVALDSSGQPLGAASLWNDTSAAAAADRLNQQADFATLVGSRLVASFTIAKLAHLASTDPVRLAALDAVALPHDWLNLKLTGRLATDRGDASGTGWWSPREHSYHRELIALAVGEDRAGVLKLPDVLNSDDVARVISATAAAATGLAAGTPVGAGTGDNMAAALGIGARPGEYVVSLGTSGTAYAVTAHGTQDPSGEVAGFADATGRFLPLACMLNCTRVVDTVATTCRLEREHALDLTADVPPGANGLLMLPYVDGERTPNLPDATASLSGITSDNATPANLVRAALDGVAAGLDYCIEALRQQGVMSDTVTLVGGGSRHPAWQQAIADATGMTVVVRGGEEHAARGAAIQVAAIVRGEEIASLTDAWRPDVIATVDPRKEHRTAFRLQERRELIRQMQSRDRTDGQGVRSRPGA